MYWLISTLWYQNFKQLAYIPAVSPDTFDARGLAVGSVGLVVDGCVLGGWVGFSLVVWGGVKGDEVGVPVGMALPVIIDAVCDWVGWDVGDVGDVLAVTIDIVPGGVILVDREDDGDVVMEDEVVGLTVVEDEWVGPTVVILEEEAFVGVGEGIEVDDKLGLYGRQAPA